MRPLAYSGQLAAAHSLRSDAVRAALPLGDPALLARVIVAFGVPRALFFREFGDTDHELAGTIEQTLSELPPGDHPLRCGLLTTLASELELAESERGYQAAEEAVAMARRLGEPGLLAMALTSQRMQSFRHDGPEKRQRIAAELLALPGKPVTADAIAHVLAMAVSSGAADFGAADQLAGQAARIAAWYDLPTTTVAITMYRAMRTVLDGDPAAAIEHYQQAAGQLDKLGLRQTAAGVGLLGRMSVLIMQGQLAEIVGDLDGRAGLDLMLPETYALGLASAGRVEEARAMAGRALPIRRDRLWLFQTAIRGLLGIALDDRERAESVYQPLLPFAAQPVGAESLLVTLWPAAQILGDLARYLGIPGADAHYQHALAIADQANAKPWREAAIRRLNERAD